MNHRERRDNVGLKKKRFYNFLSNKKQIQKAKFKIATSVTPAKAGVQNFLELLDSGFRRNDGFLSNLSFF